MVKKLISVSCLFTFLIGFFISTWSFERDKAVNDFSILGVKVCNSVAPSLEPQNLFLTLPPELLEKIGSFMDDSSYAALQNTSHTSSSMFQGQERTVSFWDLYKKYSILTEGGSYKIPDKLSYKLYAATIEGRLKYNPLLKDFNLDSYLNTNPPLKRFILYLGKMVRLKSFSINHPFFKNAQRVQLTLACIERNLPNCLDLYIYGTLITRKGKKSISNMTRLQALGLSFRRQDSPSIANVDFIKKLINLKKLGVENLINLDLLPISNLTNLTYLDLRDSGFLKNGLIALEQCSQLKKLRVGGQAIGIINKGLIEGLQNLPSLTSLSMISVKITNTCFGWIEEHLKSLSSLDMGGVNIIGEELVIAKNPFSSLRKLNCNVQYNGNYKEGSRIISRYKSLTSLEYDASLEDLTDKECGYLARLINLTSFKLPMCIKAGHTIVTLSKMLSHMPSLKKLNLMYCRKLTEDEWKAFKGSLINLDQLILKGFICDNDDLEHLEHLTNLKVLKLTSFDKSGMTIQGHHKLIKTLSSLKKLRVCSYFKEEGIKNLREAYPLLNIY